LKNRTIEKLKAHKKYLSQNNFELNELLGIEGATAKIYFQSLFEDFNWQA